MQLCLYVDKTLIMDINHDITMTTKKMLAKYFDIKDVY